MEISTSKGPLEGDVVLRLAGDLDMYTSSEVSRHLKLMAEGGKARILLDLTNLSYLDSSGVGVIIRLLQDASSKRIPVGVQGLSGTPRKVLQLCNVITLLRLFDTEAAAWKTLEVI